MMGGQPEKDDWFNEICVLQLLYEVVDLSRSKTICDKA